MQGDNENLRIQQYEKVEFSVSMKYGMCLTVFIIVCLLIFSLKNSEDISLTVQENLEYYTHLQAENIDKIIDQQIDKLESLSDFASKQDKLINESVLKMAKSMADHTQLSHVFVSDVKGQAYFNNGKQYDISKQSYFQRPMVGETVIAESTQSIVNEEDRIVLSIPIYRDKKIIGVVGGSFDLFNLDQLVFIDQETEDESYSFVMKKDGEIMSINDVTSVTDFDNFFEYYRDVDFKRTNIERLQENLKRHLTKSYLINKDGRKYYISLEPLERNEWVLGYIIPLSVAHAQYEFVYFNEVALFAFVGSSFVVYLLLILHHFRKEQRLLLQQATLDPLTSLLNKKSTEEQIKKRLGRCLLSAMIIIDIDDFKYINDHCGHDMGDCYLTRVSDCLKELFRKNDVIGRIGGDEMMVFMTDISNREDACIKVEKFLKRINELAIECQHVSQTSCSVGIAFYPDDGESFEKLYKKADIALYKTKNKGKSGYCVYEDK